MMVSASTLTFTYLYDKLNLDKLKRSDVEKNRTSIQTKLKSIKNIIVK